MKNLFGINVGKEMMDGERFKIREIDAGLEEKQAEMAQEGRAYEQKAKLPWYLRTLYYVSGAVALLALSIFLGILEGAIEDDAWRLFGEALLATWWIWVLAAAGVVGILIARHLAKLRAEKVTESEEFKEASARNEQVLTETLNALQVPSDAVETDVFLYPYREKKNGKTAPAGGMYQFMTCPTRIYRDERNVYFADTSMVLAIPVEGLHKLVKINKNATFLNWNKQEAHNKGVYKQYKIRLNGYGTYFVKPYYSLQFYADGEMFEILFPSYELETVQKITGLKVEEKNNETQG